MGWEGIERDTESAVAFFGQALARTGWSPTQVISDHHQPYVKAVQEVLSEAEHVQTGLHRARGETTKPIERSHVFTRDRLRGARGVKTLATGQRFFEVWEGKTQFVCETRRWTRRLGSPTERAPADCGAPPGTGCADEGASRREWCRQAMDPAWCTACAASGHSLPPCRRPRSGYVVMLSSGLPGRV